MPNLQRHWANIEELLRQGKTFEEIEDYIDALGVDEESRDVLWLWTWAELPRHNRQRVVPLPVAKLSIVRKPR